MEYEYPDTTLVVAHTKDEAKELVERTFSAKITECEVTEEKNSGMEVAKGCTLFNVKNIVWDRTSLI